MKVEQSIFHRFLLGAALGLGLACAAFALAQAPAAANCRADVAKFCSHTEPGRGRVAACLKESQWQLSAGCQQHSDVVAKRMSETLQACRDEALQYCTTGEVSSGRIGQCLKRENRRLSQECKALAKLLQKE